MGRCMDLECRQETVSRWDRLGVLREEREESGETIVPDTCPDIGEILCVRPRLFLQRREAAEGRGEFSGLIRVGILYRPEESGGLASLETALPFSAAVENAAVSADCILWTVPRIIRSDVHLLNSRKVLVKVVYQLEVTPCCPRTETFLSYIEDPGLWGIRQQTGTVSRFVPVSVHEKTFRCQDTFAVPADRPDPEEVLSAEARCRCGETRVVGDKLLIKGEAILDLLCHGGEGELFSIQFSLPFSQVMDGESEGDLCRVSLLLSDVSCAPDPEDPRTFRADLTVTAQGEVCRTAEIPMLSDLYSTSYDLRIQRGEVPAGTLVDRDEAMETARIILPDVSGPCQDLQITLGRSDLRKEEDVLFLDQEVRISVLCMGEDGPVGAERMETVTHRLETGAGDLCLWMAEPAGAPSASAGTGGLEITVPLTFRWLLLEDGACPVIRQVDPGEKLERGEDTPSLVVRAVGEGQTLWDMAKAYRSSQEEIMAASGLTGEELYPGQMLLIPRSAG